MVIVGLIVTLGAVSLVLGNRSQNTDTLTRASRDMIDIYLNPESVNATVASPFVTDVILNPNSHPLNRATVIISYDPGYTSFSNLEISEPFTLSALDSSTPGIVAFGLTANCVTKDCYPTTSANVASISWMATSPGSSSITIDTTSQAGAADSTLNLLGDTSAASITIQ
jgi:hypothetical protein